MKNKLEFCKELMLQVNRAHCHEIFTKIYIRKEDQEITFDVPPYALEELTRISSLLNMTIHAVPGKGEQIKFSLL